MIMIEEESDDKILIPFFDYLWIVKSSPLGQYEAYQLTHLKKIFRVVHNWKESQQQV